MPGVGSSVAQGAATGASLGSIVPGYGTVIGAGVGALAGLVVGNKQKKEAEALLKNTKYPTYTTPTEILTNQKLARMRAAVGLPSEQYKMALQNIDRNKNAAMRAAQDRRTGQGAVATAQQSANDATLNLDVNNAQARIQGERQLMAANSDVANHRDTAWAWNTQNKYNKDYNYAMAMKGYGNQNIMAGIDSLGVAAANLPWGDWIGKKDKTGAYYTPSFNSGMGGRGL